MKSSFNIHNDIEFFYQLDLAISELEIVQSNESVEYCKKNLECIRRIAKKTEARNPTITGFSCIRPLWEIKGGLEFLNTPLGQKIIKIENYFMESILPVM